MGLVVRGKEVIVELILVSALIQTQFSKEGVPVSVRYVLVSRVQLRRFFQHTKTVPWMVCRGVSLNSGQP